MPLPKAVKKQIEAGNKLFDQMYGNKPPAMGHEASPTAVLRAINAPGAPAQEEPPVEPSVEPEQQSSEPAPEAPPPVAEGEQPPAPAEPQDDEATWEQRYKSYKGVWDKQLTELRAQNKQLERQLQGTSAIIEAMKDKSTAPNPEPASVENAPQPSGSGGYLKSSDYETFGADLIEAAKRAALEAVDPQLSALRRENKALQDRLSGVDQTVTTSRADQFYGQLGQLIPNWREIFDDALFQNWLFEVDEFNRRRRGDVLQDAVNKHDAAWAASIFNKYLTESNVIKPPPAAAPKQAPKQRLDAYVAPGKPKAAVQTVGAGAAAGDEDQRVYTEAEIRRFYDSKHQGRWRGREKEFKMEEAKIHKAGMEGRVVP